MLTRQCLGTRHASREEVAKAVAAWKDERNAKQVGVDWQFTAEDARIKLKTLYPKIVT